MQKVLFDTSVLISGFTSSHPKHSVCASWLLKAKTKAIQGVISSHTLAETYAVLTKLPVKPQISPGLAHKVILNNLDTFETVILDSNDYQIVIQEMVNLSFTGGAIYDALIARCAIKASVDKILTLNPKHFTRLGNSIAVLVVSL